jgi:hypothetical protein
LIYHIPSSKNAQQRPIITAVEDITRIGPISTPTTITRTSSTINKLLVRTTQVITRITTMRTAARPITGPRNLKKRFKKKMHQGKRKKMKRTPI